MKNLANSEADYFGPVTVGSVNVVLCTGSGLKDVNAVQQVLQMPQKVKAEIGEVKKILNDFDIF